MLFCWGQHGLHPTTDGVELQRNPRLHPLHLFHRGGAHNASPPRSLTHLGFAFAKITIRDLELEKAFALTGVDLLGSKITVHLTTTYVLGVVSVGDIYRHQNPSRRWIIMNDVWLAKV